MRTGIYLLLQNCYDNYCSRGGKTNERYFLADPTTVQAFHSSHRSLCVYLNMLNINRVCIVVKVILSHNHSSVTPISDIYR